MNMNNETQNIEYKESWRDEYLQWICGMANSIGGTMFIGVNDKGEVAGVQKVKKLFEDIPNKVKDTMGVIVNCLPHEKDGKEYLEITVPQTAYAVSYRGHFYYRSGATNLELAYSMLQTFLLNKNGMNWEGQPMPEYIADPSGLRLLFHALPTSKEMLIRGGKKSGKETADGGKKGGPDGGPEKGQKTATNGVKAAEGGSKSISETELYFDVGNKRIVIKEDSSIGKIYSSVRENRYVSTRKLIGIIGINRSAILKHIETLKKYGIVTRVGSQKGGHWECIDPESDAKKGGTQ